ncbi:hypothetical protein E4U61_006828 [Claviceps capensis]|nr:hypothetical protein E4U61_006828 [Claviceps capensis]
MSILTADSGRGAEDELEIAPRRRRPRVTEYIPRRRNHGELRESVEGVDYDLTDLHEPDLRARHYPPPPELLYESFEDALAGVATWAKDHGVSYNRQRRARGGRYRLLMTSYHRGNTVGPAAACYMMAQTVSRLGSKNTANTALLCDFL